MFATRPSDLLPTRWQASRMKDFGGDDDAAADDDNDDDAGGDDGGMN